MPQATACWCWLCMMLHSPLGSICRHLQCPMHPQGSAHALMTFYRHSLGTTSLCRHYREKDTEDLTGKLCGNCCSVPHRLLYTPQIVKRADPLLLLPPPSTKRPQHHSKQVAPTRNLSKNTYHASRATDSCVCKYLPCMHRLLDDSLCIGRGCHRAQSTLPVSLPPRNAQHCYCGISLEPHAWPPQSPEYSNRTGRHGAWRRPLTNNRYVTNYPRLSHVVCEKSV